MGREILASVDPFEVRVAKVTSHLVTNIAVIRHFLDRKVACIGAEGSSGEIRIES